MTELFSLTCPTCGASLHLGGDENWFSCGHCANQYLLDDKIGRMDEAG